MYFKMLLNDLKRKKGLNLILFLFITVASLLVFVGAVQIISNLTRRATADTLCRTSDVLLLPRSRQTDIPETEKKLDEVFSQEENVRDWSTEKMMRISKSAMDYPNWDEKEKPVFNYKIHVLCAMPREHDFVYDLNDEPFYVPNGCIALPVSISNKTGIGPGDVIRFTTQYGNVYELRVSTVFKDNIPFLLRFIVSDADYDLFRTESVYASDMFSIRLHSCTYNQVDAMLDRLEGKAPVFVLTDASTVSDEFVMMEIISVFVVLISVFLILIILMTIRFTMIAELKEEEKEIGMMKALGVDSFRFRWLFAAKYTAFAVIGGVIGIAAGIPIAGTVINMFGPNVILPELWEMYLIGFLCVLGIIAVMIVFSMLVMRRIKRISVISALHGENSGERFSGNAPMLLHRRRHLRVPAFLALNDLYVRCKRYLFLVVAYTLGIAILLLPFNARHSIITPSYSRLWLYHTYDFSLNTSDETEEEISRQMEKTGMGYYEVINRQLSDAGIPAYIDTVHTGDGYVYFGENRKLYSFFWGEGAAEKLNYQKGGRAPAAEYEAAMSAYTAEQFGIRPGDQLKIEVYETNEDKTGSEKQEHQVTVTGLFDKMKAGEPSMLLWDGYTAGYVNYDRSVGYVIDAPEEEKPAVLAQMRALYGAEQVMDAQTGIEWEMSDFDELFRTLETVVGIAVLCVLALITYLYENVFISEEVPEIALLGSTGFRSGTVRKWHILRILCLPLTAAVLGELLFWSCGTPLLRLFMQQYEVTGIRFAFEFPMSFLVIPGAVIGTALLVTRLTLIRIRRIGIRDITEE